MSDIPEDIEPEVITPEEGIEDLRRQLEEAKTGRVDAERRAMEASEHARQASEQAFRASNEVENANMTLVAGAIDSLTRESSILKADYRAALSTGDYEAAADAQEAMARTQARLLHLENNQEALKNPPRTQTADPLDEITSNLQPRSAAWVKAHPEYGRDPRLRAKMVAAHHIAVADGHTVESDAYFEAVEDVLKLRKPAVEAPVVVDEPLTEAAEPVQRRSSPPPAAPVSRETLNGTRANVVRLTSEERETAAMMGMTDQEYARNKQALINEGVLH